MKTNSGKYSFLIIGMLICLCAGFGFAWSVFQLPFIQKFGWSTPEVSLTFTLQILATSLVPGLVSNLFKRIKTRYVVLIGGLIFSLSIIGTGYVQNLGQLYLANGIGMGLGIGILYPNITAYSVKYFPEKRGLVSGLLAASFGSGALIWAPIAVGLMESYGIMMTYRIFGAVFLVAIFIFAMLITDSPVVTLSEKGRNSEESIQPASVTEKNWREMVKTFKYYIIIAIFAMGSTSGLMIIGHASPIVQDTLNLSASAAAVIVGLVSIANTLGRLAWGWFSDRIGRYNTLVALFVIIAASMVLISLVNKVNIFVIMILAIGFCYGGFAALLAPLTADTFGMKYLNENYGFMYLAFGVGGVLGPRLAATARDLNNGDYSWAFIIAAGLSVLGVLATLIASRKGIPRKELI